MGYRDPISTTIGAGAMTYIVGPITGTAIGASSVIALSIAIGLIKSVFFMVGTPLLAKFMYLNNPRSAMVFWWFGRNNQWCVSWFSCYRCTFGALWRFSCNLFTQDLAV
jgi:malonate transporter MadM subunit